MGEQRWHSKPYSKTDIAAILELRHRVFPEDPYDRMRWDWEYPGNPQGPHFIQLAVDRQSPETLAGHYAVIAYQLRAGDRVVAACESLDTFTDPRYRNQGIFVGLAESVYSEAAENGVRLVLGFPNPNSLPGFVNKLGFAQPFAMHHYQRPLRLGFFTARIPGFPKLEFLEKLPIPVSLQHGVRRRWSRPEYELTPVTAVPRDWDPFFTECSRQFALLVNRDSSYMKWRFCDCPDRVYRLYELRKQGKLKGFSVLRLVVGKKDAPADSVTGQIVDWIATDKTAWRALAAESLAELSRLGAESAVLYMHPGNPIAGLVRRFGFIQRGEGTRFIVRKLKNGSPEKPAVPLPDPLKPENWFLTGGDTDFF